MNLHKCLWYGDDLTHYTSYMVFASYWYNHIKNDIFACFWNSFPDWLPCSTLIQYFLLHHIILYFVKVVCFLIEAYYFLWETEMECFWTWGEVEGAGRSIGRGNCNHYVFYGKTIHFQFLKTELYLHCS